MSGELFAFSSALIWAVSTVLWALGTQRIHVIPLNLVRCLTATAFFWALLPFYGGFEAISAVSPIAWFWLILSVLTLLVAGDILFFRSIELAGVSWAMPVASVNPLWAVLMASFFLDEPLTWTLLIGTILTVIGIALVSGTGSRAAEPTPQDRRTHRRGVLVALAVSILWGVGQIILKPATEGINSVVANSIRMPIGVVVMLFLTLWRGRWRELQGLDRRTWGILLLASLIGTGMGSLFFVYAIQLAGAGRTAVLTSISPLLAIPFSMLWLRERPTRWTLLGTLLTTVGVALVA